MDSEFTNAETLNHIHGKQDRLRRPKGYVGDLKANRKLEWRGGIIKASELMASIPASDRRGQNRPRNEPSRDQAARRGMEKSQVTEAIRRQPQCMDAT